MFLQCKPVVLNQKRPRGAACIEVVSPKITVSMQVRKDVKQILNAVLCTTADSPIDPQYTFHTSCRGGHAED